MRAVGLEITQIRGFSGGEAVFARPERAGEFVI